MQALIHAIATVQVRIQTHGPLYANKEYQTRYGLIDPILRALEWDTANPDDVQVEYTVKVNNQQKEADYVLLCCGKPLVVIEAKSLSENLAKAQVQGFEYCSSIGAAYLVCTDGDYWEFYETQNKRLLQQIKISSLNVCEAAQGLLFLWKPIVCTPPKDIPQICTPVSSASSERKVKRKSRGGQKSIPPPVPGAIPLCDLPYELASGKTQTPSYIYFPPNYTAVPVGSFKDILVRTVEYCDRLRKIPQEGVGRIVVPSGTSPGNPARYSRVESWFVCTHGSARQMVEYAIRVLKACGIDPCTVFISYQASPSLGTPTR
jgi:hypothetical protein